MSQYLVLIVNAKGKMNLPNKKAVLLFVLNIFAGVLVFFWLFRQTVDEAGREYARTQDTLFLIGDALQRYKKEQGKYPGREEWSDILRRKNYYEGTLRDGWYQPLIYRKATSEKRPFLLYSLGENGIDEYGGGDDIVYLHNRALLHNPISGRVTPLPDGIQG
ncbi:type II secretion system protein GspG [Chitinimonas lacunae]|uniref:Type II secretion system protein GspG n=1 Tax=Chitinimonas lacunae TaxID=1963018 RepID=A0ABV8MPJ7_9NEIS